MNGISKKNIECLYNSIISGKTNCLFRSKGNIGNIESLDQYEFLMRVEENLSDDSGYIDEDQRYTRLCILNNETLVIGMTEYSRVVNVTYTSSLSKLSTDWFKISEKLPFTVWSNCETAINNQIYCIYFGGYLINKNDCPPLLEDIIDIISKGDFVNTRLDDEDIVNVLSNPKLIETIALCKALRRMCMGLSYFHHSGYYKYRFR